jgi:hypothetical protein
MRSYFYDSYIKDMEDEMGVALSRMGEINAY